MSGLEVRKRGLGERVEPEQEPVDTFIHRLLKFIYIDSRVDPLIKIEVGMKIGASYRVFLFDERPEGYELERAIANLGMLVIGE
jgi:hypothetical protein